MVRNNYIALFNLNQFNFYFWSLTKGFQRQLQNYEYSTIKTVREQLFKIYGQYDQTQDFNHCQAMLEVYKQNQQAAEEAAKAKSAINSLPVNYFIEFT